MHRLGQALVLLLMATSAVGAGAVGVIALYYHRFSTDVRTTEASVPATVLGVLSPAGGTIDEPQIILVRGSGNPASGGVVLFRTAAKQETTSFLSIPPSAILAGAPVSRLDTPAIIRALSTTAGIRISHVATVNLRQGDPGTSERGDEAEQRMLSAIVGRAIAPSSVMQLPAAGRAIAETATDLTDEDVVGLLWARLHERWVVQCAFRGHNAIQSGQGNAIAAAFLGQTGRERVSGCRARVTASSSLVPPMTAFALVQQFGMWLFVALAAVSMLISLGTAALFARIRSAATPTAADTPPGEAVSGPTHAAGLFPSASGSATLTLGRAGGVIGGALAGAAATLHVSGAALGRVAGASAAFGRGGLKRVTATLVESGLPARSGYRSRARRFVYLHQDALWIGLCAAVAAGILIRLLSS